MILSRTARSAAASGGLRSLTRSSTRTECCPSDQGRFLGRLSYIPDSPRGVAFRRLRGAYDAPASDRHFLVKLVCAAPCRFCALAWSAQHFLAKLLSAAPCRLLPVAWTAQLSSASAAVATQNDAASMMANVFMFRSLKSVFRLSGITVTPRADFRS